MAGGAALRDGIGPETPAPELRFLKILVTALAGTMIFGLLAILALLVIRFSAPPPLPRLPAGVALPDGATAEAVTFGRGWIAVVTDGGAILVYDATTGALRQEMQVAP